MSFCKFWGPHRGEKKRKRGRLGPRAREKGKKGGGTDHSSLASGQKEEIKEKTPSSASLCVCGELQKRRGEEIPYHLYVMAAAKKKKGRGRGIENEATTRRGAHSSWGKKERKKVGARDRGGGKRREKKTAACPFPLGMKWGEIVKKRNEPETAIPEKRKGEKGPPT